MVRFGGDSSKRSSRHVRHEDIPTDTFTPCTYQVELLESALRGNTIACMGSASSKIFLGLMVLQEKSHQIQSPLKDGGKRSIYLTDSEEDVEAIWTTLFHHTNFEVGRASADSVSDWSAEQWMSAFSANNILVLTAADFLHCLEQDYLPLTAVNLLVMDDCHMAEGGHAYVGIMGHVTRCQPLAPHLLCLTAAILGSECSDPQQLSARISALEATLCSKAETSMLVISERFGCRPRESLIECEVDDDMTSMSEQLASILYSTWGFLHDCQVKLDDAPAKADPLHVPKFAISECIHILQTLGSWCAASIAENLISQLEKIVKHECNQTLKLFLRYTMTQLRLVVKVFENGFTPDYVIDELLNYTTPKVREFINVLRKYKPEMDFMIITREGDEGDALSDLSDDDGNDGDSLNLSSSDDEEDKGKSSKHIHIAVKKRVEKGDADNPFEEEKKLSGLVFVDNRYIAFALNKMMEEVCSWDENLCFVKSSYITGQGIHRSDGRKDLSNASHKQEEVLRKFRMQERNLLISTNVLEEGVDIPKCNLVIRFDPPRDYRSYTLSKGRARARDAEYVILVDKELVEEFSQEIQIFRGIEQVLIGAGRGRQDLEDAQEVQQLAVTPPPPFCPLAQPGAASVSMKNAIALVNRYCAKLPSDAFTHLTPQCRVCPLPSDPSQYVAYLRLPVNSPIKEELQGAAMPSRQLAKMAVALEMCKLLYKAGELDGHLQPVGKEMFVCEEEEEADDEHDEGSGQGRPGTTKRKQYYVKKMADVFVSSQPKPGADCVLYHVTMRLTGPITEDQNTRGRKLYAPEDSTQSFGLLLSSEIPNVPSFPVYTRSGEVTVSLDLLSVDRYSKEELEKLTNFHHFVFSSVLHLEKDPMVYCPEEANIGFLIVPLNVQTGSVTMAIEWSFVEEVNANKCSQKRSSEEEFSFDQQRFEDAVVMPSYRNIDQPQHFYVAEIRTDLSPLSPFPSPELYKTFAAYYTTKYGLRLTNTDQPLLDVDHTSARLNLLTPRYMNQKGRALPTSSSETKRARRENLQQKQILVPELCDIHIFSASLWRKAVCLPAILYRMNYLLLAEELRQLIATEIGIGKVQLEPGFRFPRLDFGFETNPKKLQMESRQEGSLKQEDVGAGVGKSTGGRQGSEGESTGGRQGGEGESTEASRRSVHDASPEDDRTDAGASSDSDSGVVLSESDALSCAREAKPKGSPTRPLEPGICSGEKVESAGQGICSGDKVESAGQGICSGEKVESAGQGICSGEKMESAGQVPGLFEKQVPESSVAPGNCVSESTSVENFTLEPSEPGGGVPVDDDADRFLTPFTSRPSSPTGSDSGDSMYEDAVESAPTVQSPLDAPDGGTCDTSSPVAQFAPSSQLGSPTSPPISPPSPLESPALSVSPHLSHSPDECVVDSATLSEVLTEGTEASEPCPQMPNRLPTAICSHKVPDRSSISPGCPCSVLTCLPDPSEISAVPPCAMPASVGDPCSAFQADRGEGEEPASAGSLQSQHLNQQSPQDADGRTTVCDQLSERPAPPENAEDPLPPDDCDDFLDITGSSRRDREMKTHTITFPVDPEISLFARPVDEVKVSFSQMDSVPSVDAGVAWGGTSAAADSGKEWGANEDLTTFEVNASALSDVADLAAGTDKETSRDDLQPKVNIVDAQLSSEHSEDRSSANVVDKESHNVQMETECDREKKLPQVSSKEESVGNAEAQESSTQSAHSAIDSSLTDVPSLSLSSKDADSAIAGDSKTLAGDSKTSSVPEASGWGSEESRDPSEWASMVPRLEEDSDSEESEEHEDLVDRCGVARLPVQLDAEETEVVQEGCSDLVTQGLSASSSSKAEVCINSALKDNQESNSVEEVQDGKKEVDSRKFVESCCQQEEGQGFRAACISLGDQGVTALPSHSEGFDVGVWNKAEKAGAGSVARTAEEGEATGAGDVEDSLPLLVSLDEDRDLATFVGPSPCLLLQALTMSNANDFFSLERLETIGDSFLKYAITVYLYCCYPGTHEGKLSYLRSKQVSNYNLYRLGRRKGLAQRMVSTKFEPYENWLPPGYTISEDRRRGPVPKVVIATSNSKVSPATTVNFLIEEEELESDEDQKKETAAFHAEVEEIARQQAVDQQHDLTSAHRVAMVPYCLPLHHGIPDKSIADCVEALIGCFLTTCGKSAALSFMSWLGLRVLPRRRPRDGEDQTRLFQELQCPPSPLLRSVPEAESTLARLLEGFAQFEAKIQYWFRDRSYLLQAFTHASYHYNCITDCYQRLEFLGDAILDYVITRHLYEDSQRYSPGILTDLRSALVNNNIFAALAVKWDFHKFFKAISPSLFIVIDKFVVHQKERDDQIDEYEEVKKLPEKLPKKLETDEEDEEGAAEGGGVPTAGGGEAEGWSVSEKDEETELEIPKALGDIFESVAGAIYLDSGMSLDSVWRVYYRMMKPHIDKYLKDIPKSPVRELLEMEPETAKFEKPERTLEGKIRVTVNVVGKGVFYGVGRNYRIAKSAAAKKALRFIRSLQMEGSG